MGKKLIKSKSLKPLTLNESIDSTPNNKKYIFSGVFTACSVPGHVIINRNNRSYPEKTVLAHLGYLREMIKQSGSILGELDHPEGRFDVQLKEASHKITDLWYDQANHNVMGKLEILDTPNGKIAQQLVEAGYPLFVSSRAAGDVNERTHEVEIAQIFTYDIVCTPGFAEAKLERVNENLNPAAANYLNESVSSQKLEKENTKKYKVITEGVTVCDIETEAPINEKCMELKNKPYKVSDLAKPLLEEDEEEFKLPEADITAEGNKINDSDDNKDEKKDKEKSEETKDESQPTDEEKEKKRALILNITSEDADGESSEEPSEDEDKSEKRADILDVEGQSDEEEKTEEEKSEEEKSEEKSEEEKSEEKEETDECGETPTAKAEKVLDKTEKDMEKFQKLLNNLEKKEEIKEQIVMRYPFSISLSEENFAKFAALTPNQKKKCMKYIVEHNIFTIKDINEQWDTPLNAERRILKNWLRLADPHDIELYTKASIQEQDAIENMARYMVLETKQDVDEFWEKTGLRTREAQRIMNEEFVKRYKVQQKPIMKQVQESEHPLGYHVDYVSLTEQLYNEMD